MADSEEIHLEYRFYRGAGLTLSATIISFGTVLLGWGLTHRMPNPGALYALQLLSACGAILAAFAIQLCQFHGYKHQARARFEKRVELRNRANAWFRVLDCAVWAAIVLIGFSFILSVIIWWPFGNPASH